MDSKSRKGLLNILKFVLFHFVDLRHIFVALGKYFKSAKILMKLIINRCHFSTLTCKLYNKKAMIIPSNYYSSNELLLY